MESCNQGSKQRQLMAQWKQQQGLGRATGDTVAPSERLNPNIAFGQVERPLPRLLPPSFSPPVSNAADTTTTALGFDLDSTLFPAPDVQVTEPTVEQESEDEEDDSSENEGSSDEEDDDEEEPEKVYLTPPRSSPKRRRDSPYASTDVPLWNQGHMLASSYSTQPDSVFGHNNMSHNGQPHGVFTSQTQGEMYPGNALYQLYMGGGVPQNSSMRPTSLPERTVQGARVRRKLSGSKLKGKKKLKKN